MRIVNMYDAKTNLSALVQAAVDGEEIVLARAGTPLVKLVPVASKKPSDAFGIDRGRFVIPDDFDATPAVFDEYG